MYPTLPLSILLLSIPLIGANPIPNPDLPAMQDLPPMRISAKIPDVNNQGSPEAVAAAMADPSFAADPQGVDSAALDAQVKAGGGDTQNGLSGPCKAMTVIFARGTTETGNVGTLAGPAFFDKLNAIMGPANVAVQGVPYPADIPGFLIGGDPQGSVTMAQMVKQAMTACPKTAVVMAGYSQGGQLVHNAADMLSAAESAKVSSGMSTFPPPSS